MIETMLMPEVRARRALRGRRLQLRLLVPYGAWLGCGVLRVLRVKYRSDDCTELTVGYESYERIPEVAASLEHCGP